MKTEVKNLDKSQVELTIELSTDDYRPFLNKAAQVISQNSPLAGFRPGKADLQTVINKVGKEKVWQEALEPAVQKTLVQALDQEKLITVGSPQIEIIKLAPDNPVIYKATLSLLPTVTLGDYQSLEIKTQPVEISQDQIQKVISDIQKMRAKETLSDKKAAKGDKIEIDFPMPVRKVVADERIADDKGKIAIQRGPVIYCAEWVDNNTGNVLDLLIDTDKPFTTEFVPSLLNGTQVIRTTGYLAGVKPEINAEELPEERVTLIPYALWNNRGPGQMRVWLPVID